MIEDFVIKTMATAEDLLRQVTKSFALLEVWDSESEGIKRRDKMIELDRHLQAYKSRIDEMYMLKTEVQRQKINDDESVEEVKIWTEEFNTKLEVFERCADLIALQLAEHQRKERETSKEIEVNMEKEKLQREFEEKRRLEEVSWRLRKDLEKSSEEKGKTSDYARAKLPKLMITKFNGTHLDWLRFWGQFEAEIEKSNIPLVSKFSYLKELLVPGVRLLVDGLPFTSEGYERAKGILKSKFGKTSEIINAHVQQIMSLPIINGTNPCKVHEFYEKLLTHIQALETLGRVREIDGYVRMILDRLPGIRSDLVRMDDKWQEWRFPDLVESLRKWTERNPVSVDSTTVQSQRREKAFLTSEEKPWSRKTRECVFCDRTSHSSAECTMVTSVPERKRMVSSRRLCFNCLGGEHRASECKWKRGCGKCGARHHTSICDRTQSAQQMMAAYDTKSVTYPLVVVRVNGITCRALMDTGAGSSYASSALLQRIGLSPIRKESRQVEMLLHRTSRNIDVFEVIIENLSGDFEDEGRSRQS